jgi:hypothetical protein
LGEEKTHGEKKMNPKKIAIVAAAFACAALLPVAGAQAAKHPHHMMHAHRHAPNPVVGAADTADAIAGAAIGTAGAIALNVTSPWAGPGWQGSYWAPSVWGDYECRSTTFGCRPYGAWTQH